MIKFDIISGFLGSGKTTFIKKILNAFKHSNEKIVIIENEFGEAGIDGVLLRRDGFEVYEISKGCVCCTLKNDFSNTLCDILTNIKPDRIIFEPSGIFILDEIFDLLKAPVFSKLCYINSITTIVDSVNFLKQRHKYTFFFNSQIKHASTILLSKTQLIEHNNIPNIVDALKSHNPSAQILEKPWSALSDTEVLLILDANIQYGIENNYNKFPRTHDHSHIGHHEFETVSMLSQKNFNKNELEDILISLSNINTGSILRAKGFVNSGPECLEFSYVDGHYKIDKCKSGMATQICIIGLKIDKNYLKNIFGA